MKIQKLQKVGKSYLFNLYKNNKKLIIGTLSSSAFSIITPEAF